MQKWNHCFLNFQISFGRGYDLSTADIQTETDRFNTNCMLDLELINTVLKTAANYPGCQRLFMRGFRFRVFKVAASQKKLRGLIDFIKLMGSRFKVFFFFRFVLFKIYSHVLQNPVA